ncbi:aminobenzoyl-glutamate transporter [Deltaproteobacteria bacterium]|nr:aminobenzoyl-glutamate transporter [Deltaproteobacteria bacterium]
MSELRPSGPLAMLEALGNRLPDPVVLFGIVAASIAIASAALAGVSVEDPLGHGPVAVASLLDPDLFRRIWTDSVKNFAAFPPLGSVLVAVMGIGVAERSGLIAAVLGRAVRRVPPSLLTAAMFFVGANGALASDASFVVLVPLGATLWARAGRHPLAGMTMAYAAVSGGYGANLLVTALDPLLAGLTESAARLVDPTASVSATCNWYFNIASVFVVTITGAMVAPFVERRFGTWTPRVEDDEASTGGPIMPALLAGVATVCVLAVIAMTAIRAEDGSWKPVYDSIVILIAIAALVPGLVYGWTNGTVRSSQDAAKLAGDAAGGLGGYIVLAFAAAQFIAWFNWSNLGMVSAVRGAEALRGFGLGPTTLLAAFVLLSGVVNVLIASASAKWALMAPLFVPMLLLLGVEPATTQAAYRVGDAVTNVITPLMPYMPIVLVTARRYVPGAGLGTILAAQVPFAVVWGVAWTALLLTWDAAGWPLGLG